MKLPSLLGTHPEAVIELDTGMNRGGQLPGDAVLRLADLIASMDGLKLAGLMTWEGHCMKIADPVEREAAIRSSVGKLVDMAEQVRARGIPVEIVSAGGTGTYLTTAGIEGVTEVQAGGGIWGDQQYLNLGANVEPALTIMAQVVSRPQPDRILTDAGRKTVDPSTLAPIPQNIPPYIEQGFLRRARQDHPRRPLGHPRRRRPPLLPGRLLRPVQPPARKLLRRPQRHRRNHLAGPGPRPNSIVGPRHGRHVPSPPPVVGQVPLRPAIGAGR